MTSDTADDPGAFRITVGDARRVIAGRLTGNFSDPDRLPLVCLAGLHRNQRDFTDLVSGLGQQLGPDWPVITLDLIGRGSSSRELRGTEYSTLRDARDVMAVLRSFGVHKAVWLGQGHGGQVIMAAAVAQPGMIAGAILNDSGPVLAAGGLVRLRDNQKHLNGLKRADSFEHAYSRLLAGRYPGLEETAVNLMVWRTHETDRRGRVRPRYDERLLAPLDELAFDDRLDARWEMFQALGHAPLMLMRSGLTDLLSAETFAEMAEARPDAVVIEIENQGTPALFNKPEHSGAVAGFVSTVSKTMRDAL
ncbi:alpha/beta hydrolase [Cucumibacter marinus]|uniref:alpha/beta hydrolase n=1 Tax=Cucumibacter marinus TaxID=1121252 RepID=UPI0003F9C9B1|nr:alpha/beta hydrolase [Cucumibacter marinus]